MGYISLTWILLQVSARSGRSHGQGVVLCAVHRNLIIVCSLVHQHRWRHYTSYFHLEWLTGLYVLSYTTASDVQDRAGEIEESLAISVCGLFGLSSLYIILKVTKVKSFLCFTMFEVLMPYQKSLSLAKNEVILWSYFCGDLVTTYHLKTGD